MTAYVKSLQDITWKDFSSAGGKGTNLGEMIQAGLPVPSGFVVLTDAYHDFVEANNLQKEIDRITNNLRADDMVALQEASEAIYGLFEQGTIPDRIISEITSMYEQLGAKTVAVRSSATAEDLPGVSFAGQYNTYLNVSGPDEVLQAVKQCWASLWNARAVSYRLKQDISHDIAFAVIVQQLVEGEKAGILFTANPISGRRDQVVINASWGLGEAIVSGQVSPDQWVVKKSGAITETHIAQKEVMTVRTEGGTSTVETPDDLQKKPVLTQEDIAVLNDLAQKTESYFKAPQDIEWVCDQGTCYLVQTRPITSLFPLPQPEPDPEKGLRVYLSLNFAGQGITEPLTPMGVEAFRLLYYGFSVIMWGSNARKYPDWVKSAAGRVFIDLTNLLGTKIGDTFVRAIAGKDPLTEKALDQFMEKNKGQIKKGKLKIPFRLILLGLRLTGMILKAFVDPERTRKKMIAAAEEKIHQLEQAATTLQGVDDRLRFIEDASYDMMLMMVDQSMVFSAGFIALERAEQLLKKWLEDMNVLDAVRQSLPYNPTTEMSMALLEISQKFKTQGVSPSVGNPDVAHFLRKYGHRAVLEIDMGLPRWKEDPSYVIDILNLYMEGDPSKKIEKFSQGAVNAEKALEEIVTQVRERKSRVHARIINYLLRCYREMGGLRERPKFDLVRSFSIFRDVLQDVGKELVLQGRLDDVNDIFFVTFADIESGDDLRPIAAKNKEEYHREVDRKVVPRLMTSVGESIYAAYEEPGDKTLVGIPVSPGEYEGTVRIIHHPKGAQLEPGEVLVTRSTDPAWTPLFINAGALVMETGGPMSHGSIVAREYGIPAVANVPGATTRLETGQRIRVNGVSGEVAILDTT